jgi:N6-adenosine-specific RNA methylase IME4
MLGVIPMEFDLIYADPPWRFETWSEKGRDRSPKYTLMTFGQLADMNVKALRKQNTVLFLWVTWPHLVQATELMRLWGLPYKTNAWTWKKNRIAKGYYTRKRTEVCLIGTTAKAPKRFAKNVDDFIEADVRAHSQKPDEAYERMEALYPIKHYPDRIELFASKDSMHRARDFGFIPVGFDVDKKDIFDALHEIKNS